MKQQFLKIRHLQSVNFLLESIYKFVNVHDLSFVLVNQFSSFVKGQQKIDEQKTVFKKICWHYLC